MSVELEHLDCRPIDPPGYPRRWKCLDCGKVVTNAQELMDVRDCTDAKKNQNTRLLDALSENIDKSADLEGK